MKKRLFSFASVFCILIAMFAAAGCNGQKETSGGAPESVLMNGFEYFDRDVQIIRMFNEFGRIDQNSDPEYVRSGEKSLKLTPLGSRTSTANPFIMLPTYSTRFEELAFGNFSRVEKLTFWFYNAEESEVNVGIGFGKSALKVNAETRRDEIEKTNMEYYSLKSGWNYIEYDMRHALLAMQGLNLSEVYGVAVEFDYVVSHDIADSPEIYLDDVYIVYGEEEFSTEFFATIKTGQTAEGNPYWTVCDFEDPSEAYYFRYNYAFPAPASAHPVVQTVFAAEYGVITEQGINCLLIQKKHGGTSYGWPGLILDGAPLSAAISAIGQDIIDNPYSYVLKFDVYNGSDYTGGWGIEYYDGYTVDGQNLLALYDNVSVPAKTWATHSYNIGEINEKAVSALAAYPDSGIRTFLEEPVLMFQWNRYNTEADTADRPFFIDNVRIEKIN